MLPVSLSYLFRVMNDFNTLYIKGYATELFKNPSYYTYFNVGS